MLKKLTLRAIRLYQKSRFVRSKFLTLFFLTDGVCRFKPTCSEYSYQAIDRYGLRKGLVLSLKRIIRCHPYSKGGYDPVS